ncbi:MAG: universal stress protein, partial [Anaerolineae bacterium]|nr:universal stress protein [Anaerolineae bacterium]
KELARANNSTIHLVMVVEPVSMVFAEPEGAVVNLELKNTREIELQSLHYLNTHAAALHAEGFKVETEVFFGPVVETIITAAATKQADLIAMASHGRSGLGHVFYGSVSSGVLNRVDRPLLLIRSHNNK